MKNMSRLIVKFDEVKDDLKEAVQAFLDEKGREILSTKRMFVSGDGVNLSLKEQVAKLFRSVQMAEAAKIRGYETYDEALDFDVGDEPDPLSGYELEDMEEEIPQEIQLNNQRKEDTKVKDGSAGRTKTPIPKGKKKKVEVADPEEGDPDGSDPDGE